jgi:hypothetical protein
LTFSSYPVHASFRNFPNFTPKNSPGAEIITTSETDGAEIADIVHKRVTGVGICGCAHSLQHFQLAHRDPQWWKEILCCTRTMKEKEPYLGWDASHSSIPDPLWKQNNADGGGDADERDDQEAEGASHVVADICIKLNNKDTLNSFSVVPLY